MSNSKNLTKMMNEDSKLMGLSMSDLEDSEMITTEDLLGILT